MCSVSFSRRGFLGRAPAPALQPLSMEEEVLAGKKKGVFFTTTELNHVITAELGA